MKNKAPRQIFPSTYGHLFAAVSCFSVIYVLSAHLLLFGEALVPFDRPIDDPYRKDVNRHQGPNVLPDWAVNDTPWLVELAGMQQQQQQQQQAQQQQDRAASAATTPGQIFSYHPPSVLRASIKNIESSYHSDHVS
jgi:hypothetical protein